MQRKRRGRGEGSIYQRANGRWCATISAGYTQNGRRRRQTLFGKTKQDVADELARVRMTMLEGKFVEPSKLRIADYLDRWVDDAAKPTIRETTYASYKGLIEKHIKPKIGGVMLSKLTPVQVQAMYSALEREDRSPRLRQLVHAVLSRALKQAVKWELVYRNVCDAVDRPRVPKKEIEPLTVDQVARLLAAAKGHRLEALIVVAVGTGMRLGEIFALQWQNVDLDRAAIHVKYTLTEISGKQTLSEPKTAKGRRRIDLPQSTVQVLKTHRARMKKEKCGDVPWVFTSTTGTPLRRSHFHSYVFKPLLKEAELPEIRFHDLRHTSASLLLAAGVHPKIVQERLGHAQISITLDTYSHVLPTLGLEAASKLDIVLKKKPRKTKKLTCTG